MMFGGEHTQSTMHYFRELSIFSHFGLYTTQCGSNYACIEESLGDLGFHVPLNMLSLIFFVCFLSDATEKNVKGQGQSCI